VTLATLAAGYFALAVGVQLAPAAWFTGWAQLARAASISEPDFVVASDYHIASELGYANPGLPSFDLSPVGRPSKSFAEWWRPNALAGGHAVIVFDTTKPKRLRDTMKFVLRAFDRVDEPRRVSVRRIASRPKSFTLIDAWGYRPLLDGK
jgi:hypothetical protein